MQRWASCDPLPQLYGRMAGAIYMHAPGQPSQQYSLQLAAAALGIRSPGGLLTQLLSDLHDSGAPPEGRNEAVLAVVLHAACSHACAMSTSCVNVSVKLAATSKNSPVQRLDELPACQLSWWV